MNTHKVSAHLTAARSYLSFALGAAADDELADEIQGVIQQLIALDPDHNGEDHYVPRPLKANKKSKDATAALLRLRKQRPDATHRQLGLMLAEEGIMTKNGTPYIPSHVFQLLKKAQG